MKKLVLMMIVALVVPVAVATVTGDPFADGWHLGGHSLQKGVYTSGAANYGFDIYTNVITISEDSNLFMDSSSWLTGDTVIGVGGVFSDITPAEAGWSSFSGNTVNSLFSVATGPRLQVKFGVSNAAWSVSTNAPNAGNGADGTSAGGAGALLVRSSSYFHATDPISSQETDTTWSEHAGILMELDKTNHIEHVQTDGTRPNPDTNVARLIWTYNSDLAKPATWEILLNTSLLDRLYPDFDGLIPTLGDSVIVTVQDRNSAFTNGMVSVVPEPATLALLGLGSIGLLRKRKV